MANINYAHHVLMTILALVIAGRVFGYDRPPPRKNVVVRRLEDDDSSTPQQVHVSVVGADKMRITWMTDDASPPTVYYGTSPGAYSDSANGTIDSYTYIAYKSGQIHHAVIGPLQPGTTYYYRCGSPDTNQEYSLKTPPPNLPVLFVVAGDLGQTGWTKTTLQHISDSSYDMLLLVGDLSYADTNQPFWDSFGRLVDPLASQRPWMVTQGNHEIEKIPVFHKTPFTAYNSRWLMPFEESGSDSNLYYSFDVAGSVHVIMLGSYTDFDSNSAQYNWLKMDLSKIDRSKISWIVAVIHAPWYNSNTAHQRESESVNMKKFMEDLLYRARVDVVFAGHVHAYERFTRVYQGKGDNCGPMHITIGDGGNREGLAREFIDPEPAISAFREASFGHGQFQVVNQSHALWSWNWNDDDVKIASDTIWVSSLSSNPACKI